MIKTDVDEELRDQINNAVPCEGVNHSRRTHGHDDGPARFICISPCGCGGRHRALCQGRVDRLRQNPRIVCADCHRASPTVDWQFIPI